jgi:hypothetical protein
MDKFPSNLKYITNNSTPLAMVEYGAIKDIQSLPGLLEAGATPEDLKVSWGSLGDFVGACEAQRNANLPDTAMLSLDQACAVQRVYEGRPRPFSNVVTLVPPGWSRGELISQDEFARERVGNAHQFGQCKVSANGYEIVSAGGAPAQFIKRSSPPLYQPGRGSAPGDIDFYVVKRAAAGAPEEAAACAPENAACAPEAAAGAPGEAAVCAPENAAGAPGEAAVCAPENAACAPENAAGAPEDLDSIRTAAAVDFADTWAAVEEVERYDTAQCARYRVVGFALSTGVLEMQDGWRTGYGNTDREQMRKSQLILRGPYETKGAIPAGFDLGASSVVVDGCHDVYMTLRGLYSSAFDIEIIDPRARSSSFGARILKYYNRGYGLALPGLSPSIVELAQKIGAPIVMKDLRITIEAPNEAEPNMWTAYITVTGACAKSDYASCARPVMADEVRDVLSLPHGGHTPASAYQCTYRGIVAMSRLVKSPQTQARWSMSRLCIVRIFGNVGIVKDRLAEQVAKHISMGAVTTKQLLTATDIDNFIALESLGTVSRKTFTPSRSIMMGALGMTSAEYGALRAAVAQQWDTSAVDYADISSYIAPLLAALVDRYRDFEDAGVDWWLRGDPARQWWTASLNPARLPEADWYGGAYSPDHCAAVMESDNATADASGAESRKKALAAAREAAAAAAAAAANRAPLQTEFDCALCCRTVDMRAAHVTLECGHTYCWTRDQRCLGLSAWIAEGNVVVENGAMSIEKSCPTCRGDIIVVEREPAEYHQCPRVFAGGDGQGAISYLAPPAAEQ